MGEAIGAWIWLLPRLGWCRRRVLGRSGTDHGIPAVHMSLRVNGRYMNPETALGCGRSTNHTWGTLSCCPTPQVAKPHWVGHEVPVVAISGNG